MNYNLSNMDAPGHAVPLSHPIPGLESPLCELSGLVGKIGDEQEITDQEPCHVATWVNQLSRRRQKQPQNWLTTLC